MTKDELFQRFAEQTPVTVMMRSALEWCFSPARIDAIFAQAAIRQQPSKLLFSSVVDLLAVVVWKQRDSIHQAYEDACDQFEVSVRSVYNKLNGAETQVCRALVRETAASLEPVVACLAPRQTPTLPGYRTRIIDGNHLAATEHRLKVLRHTRSGPLPGQALAVLDPDRMLIVDLFPCEDAHAQERSLLSEVLPTVQPDDLWIADRNFCTSGFLFGIAAQGGSFVIRQHASTLSWDEETKSKRIGRTHGGVLHERQLTLKNGENTLVVRQIRLVLDEPTRAGETEIRIVTNLPESVPAGKIAELYLERWTIENAFQEIEQAFCSEIQTLGYPGAALLGFSIGVLTYNILSMIKWSIAQAHAKAVQRAQLSGYYLAAQITADYGGMMIALPAEQWERRFRDLPLAEFVAHQQECAQHVRVRQFKKTTRGPKKPPPPRSSGKRQHHVSTARLLKAAKVTASQG